MFTVFIITPERDQAKVCQDKNERCPSSIEVNCRSYDSNHDHSQRQGDKAHATGHTVRMVGKGLKYEQTLKSCKMRDTVS